MDVEVKETPFFPRRSHGPPLACLRQRPLLAHGAGGFPSTLWLPAKTAYNKAWRGLAQLLGRVFHLEMVACPLCQRGALRLITIITQGEVIRKILRHLKRSADPPPTAPSRSRQALCDWVA